ncbi:hypothetical protein [uncultured Tateyamaria sp.]|uniref:DUF2730 family protein n=1 Tax=uncultured Tateyamaria sp. TaxID=455651 RepID=UPI002618B355|nr:hypothetical protein [uncultured Tateyamaria sp.]
MSAFLEWAAIWKEVIALLLATSTVLSGVWYFFRRRAKAMYDDFSVDAVAEQSDVSERVLRLEDSLTRLDEEADGIRAELAALKDRVTSTEQRIADVPTKEDLWELGAKLTGLEVAFNTSMANVNTQLSRILDTLLDRRGAKR